MLDLIGLRYDRSSDWVALGWCREATSMKAAWDWELLRDTAEQEEELVEFAADLGFDAVVVHDPTERMVERGRALGMQVIAIVSAHPTPEFRERAPECLQSVHPVEADLLAGLDDAPDAYQQRAHRWYPVVHEGDFICLGHERSLEFLERRISHALSTADGVAFDGFGFRNHYACYCDRCQAELAARAESSDTHEDLLRTQLAEAQLVDASERLYEHAKRERPDAIVTNHVWPPFNPHPTYGHQLRLDYCTQTISWFYRPTWSLERVAFEATEHRRLAGAANTFVPFVGMFDEPLSRRPPDRLSAELEIAREQGDGSLVFSTLAVPHAHDKYAHVIRASLS